ncbi:hypothetical protein LCUFL03_240031 [Latilactobacillus curvatus]|nr:hypothetical protein LCUFL03_240031 [Latilactobacillus curvatus]
MTEVLALFPPLPLRYPGLLGQARTLQASQPVRAWTFLSLPM